MKNTKKRVHFTKKSKTTKKKVNTKNRKTKTKFSKKTKKGGIPGNIFSAKTTKNTPLKIEYEYDEEAASPVVSTPKNVGPLFSPIPFDASEDEYETNRDTDAFSYPIAIRPQNTDYKNERANLAGENIRKMDSVIYENIPKAKFRGVFAAAASKASENYESKKTAEALEFNKEFDNAEEKRRKNENHESLMGEYNRRKKIFSKRAKMKELVDQEKRELKDALAKDAILKQPNEFVWETEADSKARANAMNEKRKIQLFGKFGKWKVDG